MKESSTAKRLQTELEAVRRKFRLDEQALSRFAGMLARRPETKKRRHDATIRKWSTRLCEDESKSRGGTGDDGEDNDQVGA